MVHANNKLYVGNLPYSFTDSDLFDAFSQFGAVSSARVVKDMQNGRSKGFGFVEMEVEEEANNAINELNGKTIMGRPLTVNKARPRENFGHRGDGQGHQGGGFRRPRGYSSRT